MSVSEQFLESVVDGLCDYLRWHLDWGAHEEWFRELEAIDGKPRALAYKPEIGAHQMDIWRAFCDLAGARSSNGYGPNPIAWTEIDAWLRVTGARLDAWEVRAIRRMDAAFLDWAAERVKAEAGRQKG